MEPVQTAVRTMVDRIVYEFVASLYSLSPDMCPVDGSEAVRMADASAVRGADTAVRPALETPSLAPAKAVASGEPAPAPRSSLEPVLRTLEAASADGSARLIQASAVWPETQQQAPAASGLTGPGALEKLRGRR